MAETLLSTRAQRFFMVTILLQGFVVLAMVASVFAFVEEDVDLNLAQYKTVPCYLALFILAEIFELLMAFDALRLRNVIQLVGILAFHLGLIVFAAIQIHETRSALLGHAMNSTYHKVLPFLIVSPCILAASWFALVFWIRALYFEFGWAIFHVVGANPEMKTMYQFYQIMICLLKFDFFCFIGVTTQLLIVVLQTNSAEFGLTIAAIPVVLFLLAAAGVAVQREIKWLMSISLALMLAAETYFIYKLVRFYEPSSKQQYQTTRATLTVFTIVAFLLLFATFAVGLRCFADFDKGLQSSKTHGITVRRKKYSSAPALNKLGGDDDVDGAPNMQYNAGGQLQPRISIE